MDGTFLVLTMGSTLLLSPEAVDLTEPIIVRAGEAFVALAESPGTF